jgi:hypothetical protein
VVDCRRRRIHVYSSHLELHERYYYLESFKKMAQKDPIETKTFRSETHRISGRE